MVRARGVATNPRWRAGGTGKARRRFAACGLLLWLASGLAGCGEQGTFSGTGDLGAERHGHVSLLLKDGSVLVMGGLTKTGPLASAERFVPAEGSFRPVPSPLPRPSGWAAGALLPDGRALYVGGWLDVHTILPDAALFLPDKGVFVRTRGSLATPRHDHTATSLRDGSVLVAGGNNGSRPVSFTERYLPAEDRFVPARRMLFARQQHTATLLPDGRVLIVGGTPETRYGELYDPRDGVFRPTRGRMTRPRRRHTATLLKDGRVLIAGGWDEGPLASAEWFDPGSGSFLPAAGPLAEARQQHAAVRLPDGSVLLMGGRGMEETLRSAEGFDPRAGRFTKAPARLRRARRLFTATLLRDGRALLIGGADDRDVLRSAEVFTPAGR